MSAQLIPLIEQALTWRRSHVVEHRWIEASLAAVRVHALLDAMSVMGGNVDKWRKPSGVLYD